MHSRQVQAKGTLDNPRRNGRTDGRNARKGIVIHTLNYVASFFSILNEGARIFPSSQHARTIFQTMSFSLHEFGTNISSSHQVFTNL